MIINITFLKLVLFINKKNRYTYLNGVRNIIEKQLFEQLPYLS